MTTGHATPPPQSAVVRPRDHVENVRADAIRAANRAAIRTGAPPSTLIDDTISWALGHIDHAPFTASLTGETGPSDVLSEICSCRTFLEETSWSEEVSGQIRMARNIRSVLEWLTGISDVPPTYCRETEPGDLVGGRGRIIRADAEIRHMLAIARAKLASGQTSHALAADWHHGVIETLSWIVGERSATPMLGTVRPGVPDSRHIFIEQAEAEDHLAAPSSPTSMEYHYADAVACTCRWLLGGTRRPPVTPEGQV